jgi:hypothetical protein
MSSPYQTFKQAQAILDAQLDAASKVLRDIPGVGTGPMGLTPDAVAATPEYRNAKKAVDAAFAALRAFNGKYVKRFKAEIMADRPARLKALNEKRQKETP